MKTIARRAMQVLAIGAFALIANGLAARPAGAVMQAGCDQPYVYCVEDSAAAFDCCMYQADPGTQGSLCGLRQALTRNSKLSPTICGTQLAGSISSCAISYGRCIARPLAPNSK